MTITTLAELETAVATYSNRTDMTARMGEFVTLFEAKANRRLRLPTLERDETLSLTSGNRRVALPSAFIQPLALWIVLDSGREPMTFVPASEMVTDTTDGRPDYWTIDGGYVAFEREADQTYTFTLRCKEGFALATTDPNWLLTHHPDAYLTGCLAELFSLLMDNEQEIKNAGKRDLILNDVAKEIHRSRALAQLRTDTPTRAVFDITRGY